jgi:hypothetical protein
VIGYTLSNYRGRRPSDDLYLQTGNPELVRRTGSGIQ